MKYCLSNFVRSGICVIWGMVFVASLWASESVTVDKGTKDKSGRLSILQLHGSWYEMGRQYGMLMQKEMQKVLARSELKATAESDAYLLPNGLPMGVEFLDQLFAGAAEGAGMTLAQMVRLNGLELAYAFAMEKEEEHVPGKCSALALFGNKTQGGKVLYGRNYDWIPEFCDLDWSLTVFNPEGSTLSVAMLNYAGCFYLTTGMNSKGLFVEMNDGSYSSLDQVPAAIHNAWMLWQVLLQTQDTDQAVRMLNTIQGFSNYIIGIADSQKSVSFEWGIHSKVVIEKTAFEGMLAMTNHFVQPGWKNLPSAEEGGNTSSVCRRNGLVSLADKVETGTATIDTLKNIFDVTVENGGAKWDGTLCQTLAVPAERTLLIRMNNSQSWVPFVFPAER